MVSVRGAPGLTVPTVQTPPTYVPWLGVAETKVRPAGKRSCTLTFVAAFGPRLIWAPARLTVDLTLGVALLTVLPSCRSACCGVAVALPVLFPVLGSNW